MTDSTVFDVYVVLCNALEEAHKRMDEAKFAYRQKCVDEEESMALRVISIAQDHFFRIIFDKFDKINEVNYAEVYLVTSCISTAKRQEVGYDDWDVEAQRLYDATFHYNLVLHTKMFYEAKHKNELA